MTKPLASPEIGDKVAFLSNAGAYPGYRGDVEVLETHMSWIFLTSDQVYKLKKPITRHLIDFSSTDARYRNCREEVRLNRRLGGNTYIGIEALSLGPGGQLHLGKKGVAVDWLVVMRRLPESAMLDFRIKAGQVDDQALAKVAALLTEFYRQANVIELTARQYRRRLEEEVGRSQGALLSIYGLPRDELESLETRQLALLASSPRLFDERIEQNMIVEAHGDLRPEHVCLTDPPVIIDCLEFNRDLRVQDRVDELAFLAMECERLGNSHVGEVLFGYYIKNTGDRPHPRLVAFYKSYRACVRAKLCAWHLEDDPQQRRGCWLEKAQTYLDMATGYAEHFDDCVLSGSGVELG